jgi:hypothetical protein
MVKGKGMGAPPKGSQRIMNRNRMSAHVEDCVRMKTQSFFSLANFPWDAALAEFENIVRETNMKRGHAAAVGSEVVEVDE